MGLKVSALVDLSRESINKVVVGGVGNQGVDQELADHVKRHILSLVDELLHSFSIAATFLHLGANKVASRDVHVAEFLNELLALSSFATSWGASHEGNLGVAKLLSDIELSFSGYHFRLVWVI